MKRIVQQDGFTLIEMMVVIVTIVVLAAMLLPALASTRQNSQSTGCLANQRQLVMGWMMYARDNNDVLVPNRGLAGQVPLGTMSMDPRFDADLRPGGQCADWCPGDLTRSGCVLPGNYPGGSRYSLWIQTGLLYPYINHIGAYRCPADRTILPRTGGPFTAPALRTYSMNGWVQPMDAPGYATTTFNGIHGFFAYTKLSSFMRPGPSKTFVFTEEGPYSIDDGFWVVNPTAPTQWYSTPAILHDTASVLAFADGHSDAHRWTDRNMIYNINPKIVPGDNVPADPDSEDLKWLISISTVVQ